MRRSRVAMYLVLVPLSIVVSLAVISIAINCYDPPLDPAAAAAFQPVVPVSDEDNLYLALQGLNAPEQSSITAYAKTRNTEYLKYIQQMMQRPADTEPPPFVEQHALKQQIDSSWCKGLGAAGFWDAAQSAALRNNGFKDAVILQRYWQLSDFRGFAVPTEPVIQVPWVLRDARCAFAANLVGGLSSQKADERAAAMRLLRTDITFWRHLQHADADFAIIMSSLQSLGQDWALLADALARIPGLAAEADAAASDGFAWSKDSDWSTGNGYRWEARRLAGVLREIPLTQPLSLYDRIGLHFFKLNASINQLYEVYHRFSEAADARPREMEPRFKKAQDWSAEHSLGIGPRMLYNPLGRAMTSLAFGWEQSYQWRAMDVAALERLTHLSYEIHLRRVPVEAVPAWIGSHPELGSHPVSAIPFSFDPVTTELAFVPVEKANHHGRTQIRLIQ